MKVLLSIFVILAAGDTPKTSNIEMDSMAECVQAVKNFLENKNMITAPVRGAGCIVVQEERNG